MAAPPTTFDPASPFLRQEGLCAGLSKHVLDGTGFHKLFRNVRVAVTTDLDHVVLARAAVLVVPQGVVSHHTAARFYGVVVPESPVVHLTVPERRSRSTRAGLTCHVGETEGARTFGTVKVTSPEQTFVDLAGHLDLVDLVILGDSMLHKGVVRINQLLDAAEAMTGRHARHARRAADLVRQGAESPMETRLRLLLVLAGFPEPRVQLWLEDENGQPCFRLDLAYPELRVAIEYDGRQHAEDQRQWAHDIGRREWLDGQGWRLVVMRSVDIFGDPWATVLRIGKVLAERGYERELCPSPPPAFSRHFPAQPWRTRQR